MMLVKEMTPSSSSSSSFSSSSSSSSPSLTTGSTAAFGSHLRLGSLALPLALPLQRAGLLGIPVRQVTVARAAVRTHHGELHFDQRTMTTRGSVAVMMTLSVA